MNNLFLYCYYRISKFYIDWNDSRGYITGSVLLLAALSGYVLSVVALVSYFLDKQLINTRVIGIICGSFCIIGQVFTGKRRYRRLEIKYKNEKHKKLKGWFVFIFIVFSFVLFVALIVLHDVYFDDNPINFPIKWGNVSD